VANEQPRRRTAEFGAAARALNRNPKLLSAVSLARERLLGDDQIINRPALSRRRTADRAARQLGALRGDSPGVLGELALIALQAWQNFAEHQGRGRGDVDVAILFTDLVGFSSWALDAGDEPAIALLSEVNRAIEPPILAHKGEVVKRLGDGLMAAFWDAASAAEAAFEARNRLASIDVRDYVPQLRTGVHLGRPRKIGGDYFGIDVNIAARLAEAAGPGEVLISRGALDTLGDAGVVDGERRITAKGAPANLAAFVVEPPRHPATQVSDTPEHARGTSALLPEVEPKQIDAP
jgi:class 3 adenylate cyclase